MVGLNDLGCASSGVKGDAKWVRSDRIQIGPGEVILSGSSVDPKARPVAVSPRFIMEQTVDKKLMEAADKNAEGVQEDVAKIEFDIDQMVGPVVVHEFKFIYRFRR